MSKMMILHTFYNPVEIEIFKSKLESEGITSYILDQNLSYTVGPVTATGYRLQIREDDYIKAKEILDNHLQSPE